MARIVIDARESGTSTGRYVDKLVEYLYKLKSEHEFIILTKNHRVEFMRTIAPGFRVEASDYKEFTLAEQFRLREQLRELNADLVHFSMPQQPIYYYGKSITTFHDLTTLRFTNPTKNWLMYKFKQSIYRFLLFWVAHKSRHILAISEFTKKDVAKFAHIKTAKISVVYEAADKINAPAKPIKSLADQKFIMYVGRATPHKNLERLVLAFKVVRQRQPNLLLVLAGKQDANYKRLEKLVVKEGLNDAVVFPGFIDDGQLRWLYENAAAYVFPSLSEGFGLPGLEAMVHGSPVISSDATCLPEIYGDAALYFNPLDTTDMAAKISDLLNDHELRADLVSKGRAQVNKYSWAKTAQQTLEIYTNTLS